MSEFTVTNYEIVATVILQIYCYYMSVSCTYKFHVIINKFICDYT